MTLEEQFITKTYYKVTYMNENEEIHPVQVLGDAYFSEQQNEIPDLSFIRFAQGEVYFHQKDFETAIFKWENIHNELEPWARKNMGDAYLELGLLSNAEEIYKSIKPESSILHAEVSLQLFSLYINQGKIDKADKVLKDVVSLNPDYPNVTDIARSFYEEHEKIQDAIELAVNEGIRTESIKWFDYVKMYIDKGWTNSYKPEFFKKMIISVQRTDQKCFEQIVSSLWKSYSNKEFYLSWIEVINSILLQLEVNKRESWQSISSLLYDTYLDLMDGKYFIREVESIIPNMLSNWLKVASQSHRIFASSAILAWNEMFPASIDTSDIHNAEDSICQTSKFSDVLSHSLKLFESISKWAESHELKVGKRTKWWIQQIIDLNVHHVMVVGPTGNGKSSFINSILGENVLKASTSSIVQFKDNEEVEINEITDTKIKKIMDLSEFHNVTASQLQMKCVDFQLPCNFLNQYKLAIIDSPSFQGNLQGRNEFFHYLQLADSLIFVLNANVPFTDKECDVLLQIQKYAPSMPINFVLNKIDTIYSEGEVNRITEETESRLQEYFQNAKVIPYSSVYESSEQLSKLGENLYFAVDTEVLKQERTEKLLYMVRRLITELLEKRVAMEKEMVEAIKWSEGIMSRLNGGLNQLRDLESDKVQHIQMEYQMIEEEIRNELINAIPSILKECSNFIKEDSDFRKMHSELNEEMNQRIQDYMHKTILPKYYNLLQKWIGSSHDEFKQCKIYLGEMCEGLNKIYGEERLKLEFDFRIIDDWIRDADRMTNAVRIEKVNILSKQTPTQLLLKGAGKLFGAIPQNKAMLYNKYKSFVENEDYYQVSVILANKFLQQFDLFAKGLERDIKMFFRNPLANMGQIIEETQVTIQNNKDILMNLRSNPEQYKDPLTIFEVNLRQYEWIKDVGKEMQPIY